MTGGVLLHPAPSRQPPTRAPASAPRRSPPRSSQPSARCSRPQQPPGTPGLQEVRHRLQQDNLGFQGGASSRIAAPGIAGPWRPACSPTPKTAWMAGRPPGAPVYTPRQRSQAVLRQMLVRPTRQDVPLMQYCLANSGRVQPPQDDPPDSLGLPGAAPTSAALVLRNYATPHGSIFRWMHLHGGLCNICNNDITHLRTLPLLPFSIPPKGRGNPCNAYEPTMQMHSCRPFEPN